VIQLTKHSKINLQERKLISIWLQEGLSNKECARRLRRAPSTIGREVKRNRYHCEQGAFYLVSYAQSKAQAYQKQAWQGKHPLKNPTVYAHVIKKLRQGWSPEQITGRLKKVKAPNDPKWHICHETIYRFIYHPTQKQEKWWEYLRRGHIKRRRKAGRKVHRCRIPDRVSIHHRPDEANQRQLIGHWEGDTIVGKGQNHGLHTAYERYSSLIRIALMKDLTSESSIRAQIKIYSVYPYRVRKTTTLDNGHEHVQHTKLSQALNMQTYFADPYSSWQRGGNENANLWIRYYFPKGTDFRTISPRELKAVEWELNNRPRKRLNYLTPQEVFNNSLNGLHS